MNEARCKRCVEGAGSDPALDAERLSHMLWAVDADYLVAVREINALVLELALLCPGCREYCIGGLLSVRAPYRALVDQGATHDEARRIMRDRIAGKATRG